MLSPNFESFLTFDFVLRVKKQKTLKKNPKNRFFRNIKKCPQVESFFFTYFFKVRLDVYPKKISSPNTVLNNKKKNLKKKEKKTKFLLETIKITFMDKFNSK